jgi:hypothetical protein
MLVIAWHVLMLSTLFQDHESLSTLFQYQESFQDVMYLQSQ